MQRFADRSRSMQPLVQPAIGRGFHGLRDGAQAARRALSRMARSTASGSTAT
jgi:hypothetical protein